MRLLTLLLATTMMVSLQPSASQAGYRLPDDAHCQVTVSDGQSVGGCFGTMKGFADSPDPKAYAGLRVRANGTIFFEARADGVLFTCLFADTFDAQYLASFAGDLQNSHFSIGGRGGICGELSSVERGSLYGAY
jgi:hypothetical protein